MAAAVMGLMLIGIGVIASGVPCHMNQGHSQMQQRPRQDAAGEWGRPVAPQAEVECIPNDEILAQPFQFQNPRVRLDPLAIAPTLRTFTDLSIPHQCQVSWIWLWPFGPILTRDGPRS